MGELKNHRELHRKTFELTLALYRVTDFFQQGEALKRSLREKANEIFGGVTEYGPANGHEQETPALLAKIETIRGYLGVARSMRFVRPINLTILEREYEFLEHFFKGELPYIQNNVYAGNGHERPGHHRDDMFGDHDQVAEGYHEYARDFPVGETSSSYSPAPEKISRKTPQYAIHDAVPLTERQKKILGYVRKAPRAKIGDFQSLLSGVSAKTIQRDLHDLTQRDVLKKEGKKRWTIYSLK